MTYRPGGPSEVQPNTLRDQRMPNTFRSKDGTEVAARQDLNSGGGKAAPRVRRTRLRLPLWVYLAVAVVVVCVALLVLSSTT